MGLDDVFISRSHDHTSTSFRIRSARPSTVDPQFLHQLLMSSSKRNHALVDTRTNCAREKAWRWGFRETANFNLIPRKQPRHVRVPRLDPRVARQVRREARACVYRAHSACPTFKVEIISSIPLFSYSSIFGRTIDAGNLETCFE